MGAAALVSLEEFRKGDVYLGDDYEDMRYRYEHATNKVFVRSGNYPEVEIPHSNRLFNEAVSSGTLITKEQYHADI